MRRHPFRFVARIALSLLAVWAIYLLKANVWFRLYPLIMVSLALAAFAVSLWRTPLVEVFARKTGESLDPSGVAYCRNVTRVWVAFLSVHWFVTLATVFAPYEVWIAYNGCVAYGLMGLLFIGELFVRRRVRRV